MLTKTVDTNAYVSVLRELVEEGEKATLLLTGSSMAPFLVHHRDYIYFEKPTEKLRKGDMVFYQRENGQYIMHRIYKIRPEGYYMVGDAQTAIEGPLRGEQIFAIVTKVKRKGKWIGSENLCWNFFAHVWIRMVLFRRIVLKLYKVLVRKEQSDV